jgi:hypothetical protein
MTRINRTSGPGGPGGVEGPKGPQRSEGPDDANKADFVKNLSAASPAAKASSPEAALAARMHARIKEGLEKSRSREEILSDVIDAELAEAFGRQATPGMKESVSAAFAGEPRLRSMFNDLFDRATRGG